MAPASIARNRAAPATRPSVAQLRASSASQASTVAGRRGLVAVSAAMHPIGTTIALAPAPSASGASASPAVRPPSAAKRQSRLRAEAAGATTPSWPGRCR